MSIIIPKNQIQWKRPPQRHEAKKAHAVSKCAGSIQIFAPLLLPAPKQELPEEPTDLIELSPENYREVEERNEDRED